MRTMTWIVAALAIVSTPWPAAGSTPNLLPADAATKLAVNAQFTRPVLAGRLGPGSGEDFASAIPITSLPFTADGNTCAAANNYDPACAFDENSEAADLVYVLHTTAALCVDISLCGSGFDTVLHVYKNDPSTSVGCSDDVCTLDARLSALQLEGGNDYYIVVDGWASQCGAYHLSVANVNPTVSGRVSYYEPALPNTNRVANVAVCILAPAPPDACAPLSDLNGIFKATNVTPAVSTLAASRTPAATDPGTIGGGDVNVLISALVGIPLTPDQQVAADVDGSGGPPNVTDLQCLRRYVVFDFAACPLCATWKFFCDPLGVNASAPCAIGTMGCSNAIVDLKAILLADVDGSWPNRAKAAATTVVPLTFGTAAWNGAECVLPVLASIHDTPLTSVVFSLEYDAAALEFEQASVGSQAAGFELTLNPEQDGVVHGLLAGGTALARASGEVLELHFRLRQGSDAGSVSFARLAVNDRDAEQMPAVTVSHNGQTPALPLHYGVRAIPNPFNPTTSVEYLIPAGDGVVPVALRIVDLGGRVVRELLQAPRAPGRYRATWDGTDASGTPVASGVYLIHLRAGRTTTTQKAVLLR